MLRQIIFILLFSSFLNPLHGGNNYWIFFSDKSGVEFNPYEYFSRRTIEKRILLGVPLYNETDLPLNQKFVEAVRNNSGRIIFESRWMNAVAAEISNNKLIDIVNLPFVTRVEPVKKIKINKSAHLSAKTKIDTSLLIRQTEVLDNGMFRERGFNGNGIRIAVLDAGFRGADKHPAFEHLRKNGQIVATYDFVRKKEFVYSFNSHGTAVLSCIAGMYDTIPLGLATGAEFLLARTEVSWEPFSEEINWMAAMEWADKNGADIINSSLGYTYHRYHPYQMDGKTTFITQAAKIAASKGMLVINSMGNDGATKWKFAGAPADAQEVLSIGGIDPLSHLRIDFSSIGPNASMHIKPDISAYAEVIAASSKKFTKAQGTSFSAPLITGFAACLWQAKPELSNREIFKLIQQSGNLYPYYDYAHGYGMPDLKKLFQEEVPETFEFTRNNNMLNIVFFPFPEDRNTTCTLEKILFYHIERNGRLSFYGAMKIETETIEMNLVNLDNMRVNDIIRIHFRGYTKSYSLSMEKKGNFTVEKVDNHIFN